MDMYDRQGQPISMDQWSQLLVDQGLDYKRVAETQVGPYWVSTVWLGMDHNFGEGPPLIFETMVFLGNHDTGDGQELDCLRYSTEAEAIQGHEDLVTRFRDHHPEA